MTTIVLLLVCGLSHAQNCASLIAEDKTIKDINILRMHPTTLVVRGNYSYALTLQNETKGVVAKVISKAGELLNRDDEVIFMDVNQVRKSYRFVETGNNSNNGGTPISENILQLDLDAAKWLASTSIVTIYIKNNVENQMRKFTVIENRQQELKQMAVCFVEKLNPDFVNDVKVDADVKSMALTSPSTDIAESPSSSNNATKTASPNTDGEVKDLQAQLQSTKQQLRIEIEEEKKKATENKIENPRRNQRLQKRCHRPEKCFCTRSARGKTKSQQEIEEARKALAKAIEDAKAKADNELEQINLNVQEARQKASAAIETAKLESAKEVAATRESAAKEVQAVKEKMDNGKIRIYR
ncbi:MAG: hypothetical protein HC912_12575 [Saprospiraceae bacterium]|nr:hypothetical protein [Saprospiraceae bacterium]